MSQPVQKRSPWMIGLWILLALLLLADFIPGFMHHVPTYYLVMAFAGSTGLLVLAKVAQGLLQRKEGHYDD